MEIPNTLLYTAIAVLIPIISFCFLFISNRRNWKNAPPGPTGWPILGILPQLTERFYEDLFHLSKKYGPLMSMKMGLKPAIVVSSPEVACEVLKEKEAAFSDRNVTGSLWILTYGAKTLAFSPYGPEWRMLKRLFVAELFASKTFESFEPLRKSLVHHLLKQLYTASLSKSSVNVIESVFVVLANVVSNLAVSESLFDITRTEGKELKQIYSDTVKVLGTPNIADLIPILKPFDPQGFKRKTMEVFKRFDDFYEELVNKRLEERKKRTCKSDENERKDVLDVLLDCKSDHNCKELPKNVVKAILSEFFFAGTETTSNTIEWGVTEILRKPDVYKKVLSELDQVAGKHRFIQETDISSMPYYQATIKEVFRLHPGVPLFLPRRTNEACQVQNYHVPKDCIVFVNVWGMARDPKIWDSALEFKPERFVGSSVDVKGQHFNLLTFGSGRRACTGWPLAHRMVHFCVAALLHAFEWDIPRELLDDNGEKVGLAVRKSKSLVGVPKHRLADSVYQ